MREDIDPEDLFPMSFRGLINDMGKKSMKKTIMIPKELDEDLKKMTEIRGYNNESEMVRGAVIRLIVRSVADAYDVRGDDLSIGEERYFELLRGADWNFMDHVLDD